jgi:hypothetical protein
VIDVRYELRKRWEHAQLKIAKMLPRWLVYWAYIRVAADVTTGALAHTPVPEVGMMDALKAWEK